VKKHIGRAEREILVPVSHGNYFFKSPMYMAFPTAADPADRAVDPLSPLPCQAWHGYGVSSAHHREVRGCRRTSERTRLRGRRRCAAGGRRNDDEEDNIPRTMCSEEPDTPSGESPLRESLQRSGSTEDERNMHSGETPRPRYNLRSASSPQQCDPDQGIISVQRALREMNGLRDY
jgi:hypothetical protein